ncbi:penicillin-binding protein 1C [Methylobrevis albus]|uniref:peptidoglycan glycosyltransferase n=1 Tax=Methylobrevis albus TaxID=2793297 RepID=A0A931N0X8_9HYPH|nr:penicillin-binding protein 1C [Methylobrevis albus]MBH0239709.1 penicillin-binding protein 1C [Methylobrevis albus]
MKPHLAVLILLGLVATAAPLALREAVATRRAPDLVAPASVAVVDRNDALLRPFVVADGLWRLPANAATVDATYLAMLEAYEDRRFRAHRGVDVAAVGRAAWQLVRHGRIVSGGSTLTMQVARLAARRHTRTAPGKLSQMLDALALERRYGKAEIVDAYLMLAPFGGNLEGVRAASLAWFGKEPRRLTPAEAALLVALPQAPELRRPDRHPDAARAARSRVLQRAVGAGILTADAAAAAEREPIPTRRRDFPILAAQSAERAAAGAAPGSVVPLTLDAHLQGELERLATERAPAIGSRVSIAIVVADHATGEIRASVGSAGLFDEPRKGFVDMTRALRSPGSTLKPFIYGLAFDAGIAHPETLVEDRPTGFAGYAPKNFDRVFHGTLPIRRALELSLNVPAVEVLDAVGPARLIARMRRAGVRPALSDLSPPGLAIGLGGVGLTLEDLVTLYAALARGGMPVRLSDRPGESGPVADARPVLDPRSAAYITAILAGGPGITTTASRVAIKTGTSYGYRDAWAIGYDGRHVIGVWAGRADGAPVPGLVGVEVAVPILRDAFVRAGGAVPLPPAPAGLLTVAAADLPPPLRRFASRRAAEPASAGATAGAGPDIAYPPDGARIELALPGGRMAPLPLKVRSGTAPFTWFVDGEPLPPDPFARTLSFEPKGAGFVSIAVIDAAGRADRVKIFVERPAGGR